MVGMLLGMLLARLTAHRPLALWSVFLALTAFHVFANFRAMRSLCLTSLNLERASILLDHFVRERKALSPQQVPMLERALPLPQFPAWLLPVLPPRFTATQRFQIHFGAQLSALHRREGWARLENLRMLYKAEHYLLVPSPTVIAVVLHRHVTRAEQLQACVHALVLARHLAELPAGRAIVGVDSGRWQAEVVRPAESKAAAWMASSYSVFLQEVAVSGWSLEQVLLSPGEWRAEWAEEETHEE
eukprot:TRINITY_DN21357_c0_g1_i1.p1 TRINITY_DN21357_c0_g1~~TRINITY_DN21357_c0_g1_i1.p1  ORF type:complete len:265 (+),score=43.25 TRINITY_DN21357_c0_g1_i1:65-796(+)